MIGIYNSGDLALTIHPALADNIAPNGGPGSDVIVEGIPPWDGSWVQDGSFYTLLLAECY